VEERNGTAAALLICADGQSVAPRLSCHVFRIGSSNPAMSFLLAGTPIRTAKHSAPA
jgi:hypothetical protein